jgi:hypothetical protein
MEPRTVVALISTLAQTAQALAPEVEKAIQIMSSHDAGEIRAALAALQAAGDDLHGRVPDAWAVGQAARMASRSMASNWAISWVAAVSPSAWPTWRPSSARLRSREASRSR